MGFGGRRIIADNITGGWRFSVFNCLPSSLTTPPTPLLNTRLFRLVINDDLGPGKFAADLPACLRQMWAG